MSDYVSGIVGLLTIAGSIWGGWWMYSCAEKIQQRDIRWFERHPGPKFLRPLIESYRDFISSPAYVKRIRYSGIFGFIVGILAFALVIYAIVYNGH